MVFRISLLTVSLINGSITFYLHNFYIVLMICCIHCFFIDICISKKFFLFIDSSKLLILIRTFWNLAVTFNTELLILVRTTWSLTAAAVSGDVNFYT